RQMLQNPPVITTDQPANLTLWPGLNGVNSASGYEQFNQHNNGRSTVESGGSLPPYIVREQSQFYAVKEQVQSIVKRFLKDLS
ncbi:hypothetical protein J0J23_22655, partial [Vibrio vulnificus]|uniref:hypothetical protein n=1 Tax=Vibrio vulnificus TaxID=672 RepID=UPI0019D4773A